MGLFVVLLHHPINQLSAAPLQHVEQEGTAFIFQCYSLLVQIKECNDIIILEVNGTCCLMRLYSVHLHFAQALAWKAPTGYYSISKCSVKGRLVELNCMEHFPFFAIVAHGCVWKHDMEMFF